MFAEAGVSVSGTEVLIGCFNRGDCQRLTASPVDMPGEGDVAAGDMFARLPWR